MIDQDATISDSRQRLLTVLQAIYTTQDLANLLHIDHTHLIEIARHQSPGYLYRRFPIKRKTGKPRWILAPTRELKELQRALNGIFQVIYYPKPSAHGFIVRRNIVTNAAAHLNRPNVLNIDLQDFFSSITLGRVRGMLKSPPYRLHQSIATILAQICCFEDRLPQGAPTSPVISNMICAKLDSDLQHLAKAYHCTYTRYADDITLSTHLAEFPSAILVLKDSQVYLGNAISTIIRNNGFHTNNTKTRLQTATHRQQVTGIVVNNDRPTVTRTFLRQIRAMLHDWEVNGIDAAQEKYESRPMAKKPQAPWKPVRRFEHVLRGRIAFVGMVRGKGDSTYLRFCKRLSDLEEGTTSTNDS